MSVTPNYKLEPNPRQPQGASNSITMRSGKDVYREQIAESEIAPSVLDQNWRKQFAAELVKLGYIDQAATFLACGKRPAAVITCAASVNHTAQLILNHCDNKLCPSCAGRESRRLVNHYAPRIQQIMQKNWRPGWALRHVVLTTDISARSGEAANKVDRLFPLVELAFRDSLCPRRPDETARAWRDRWQTKKRTIGLLCAFEFGENGRKLHFHVDYYGPFIPQPVLSAAWQNLTDYSVVWISLHDNKPVAELLQESLKYITKFVVKGEAIPPFEAAHIYHICHGRRRIRSYGLFYNMPEPPADDEPGGACPVCQADLQLLQINRALDRINSYAFEMLTDDEMPDLGQDQLQIVAACMLRGDANTQNHAREVWAAIWQPGEAPDPADFSGPSP